MNNLELSNRIKSLCKSHKVAVKTLLEACNINRNFIYDLERDKSPSIDKISLIADYLECSVDYLLGRTDNPNINK